MNGMAYWSCFHFAASNETCREDAQIKQNCFQQTQRLLVHWMEPTRILSLQDMKCQAFMALNSSSEARYSASSACKRKLLPENMEVLLVHPGFSKKQKICESRFLRLPLSNFPRFPSGFLGFVPQLGKDLTYTVRSPPFFGGFLSPHPGRLSYLSPHPTKVWPVDTKFTGHPRSASTSLPYIVTI